MPYLNTCEFDLLRKNNHHQSTRMESNHSRVIFDSKGLNSTRVKTTILYKSIHVQATMSFYYYKHIYGCGVSQEDSLSSESKLHNMHITKLNNFAHCLSKRTGDFCETQTYTNGPPEHSWLLRITMVFIPINCLLLDVL